MIGVAFPLVLLYAYLGATYGETGYYALAFGLLGWLVVFFTEFWEAILYLPAALAVAAISVFWILRGVWDDPINLAAIALSAVFLVLASSLLVFEDPAV